jgi:hypothetical protein
LKGDVTVFGIGFMHLHHEGDVTVSGIGFMHLQHHDEGFISGQCPGSLKPIWQQP